jgi:hypothetical protein
MRPAKAAPHWHSTAVAILGAMEPACTAPCGEPVATPFSRHGASPGDGRRWPSGHPVWVNSETVAVLATALAVRLRPSECHSSRSLDSSSSCSLAVPTDFGQGSPAIAPSGGGLLLPLDPARQAATLDREYKRRHQQERHSGGHEDLQRLDRCERLYSGEAILHLILQAKR